MPHVFISYRKENDDHAAKVRALAEQLRNVGIEVVFDQFVQDEEFDGNQPTQGWPLWSIQQADQADSVLIIASAGWFRVFQNTSVPYTEGFGAAAEATVIFQRLYKAGLVNEFAAIGVMDDNDLAELPTYLDSKCGRFGLSEGTAAGFENLAKWLNRTIASSLQVHSAAPDPADPPEKEDPFPELFPLINREGFVNCLTVFRAWDALIARNSSRRILLIEGPGEHGKSTLLTKLFNHSVEHLPHSSSAHIRFSSNPPRSTDDLLDEIADELGESRPQGSNIDQRTRHLLDIRSGKPTILFFDAFEHTENQHAYWVDFILKRARRDPWLRCIIAGRRTPSATSAIWTNTTVKVGCDALSEPDALVAYAHSMRDDLPAVEVHRLCEILKTQRELGISGASSKLAITLIDKMCAES